MDISECPPRRLRIRRTSRLSVVGLHELHERIVGGDRASLNELIERLQPVMRRRLRRVFPRATDDFIVDAIVDALLEYSARPGRVDLARGVSLDRFLQQAARRNLQDRLRADARRLARESRYAAPRPLTVPARTELDGVERSTRATMTQVLAAIGDATEREAFIGWITRRQPAPALAAALGLAHLPIDQQRRAVKRFKDRVIKRLLRHFRRGRSSPRRSTSPRRRV